MTEGSSRRDSNASGDQAVMAESQKRLLSQDDFEESSHLPRRRRSLSQVFRSWFGSFSLGVVATLAAVSIWQSMPKHEQSYSFAKTDALPDSQLLQLRHKGDLTDHGPVPYETIMFEADPLYSLRPSDDTDFAWNMLLPVCVRFLDR